MLAALFLAGDTTANVRLHERIRRAHTWHESSHTWREADGAEEEEEDEAEEEEEEQKPPRRASGRTAPEEPVRRTRGARVNYGGAEASEEERPEQRPQRLTRTATGSRPKAPTFQPELRRSGRARVSRLVTVNGHAVLRSNLGAGDVDVMEGEYAEASDEEEGDEDEAGNDTEEEESESSDFLRSPEDHRPAAKKARKEAQHSTRTWGAREASRLARNRAMDEAADALEPAREAFLASHLPLLAPFLEARVVARLQRRDASLGVPEREVPTPPQIIASLRPHQLVGLRYLANAYERGLHPILGDEMGLGKTLQAICLLAHACFALDSGPHLVVCPLSVLPTWQAELQRWCPALRVVRAHSSDVGERERLRDGPLRDPQAFDVVVTTYEMLTSDNFSSILCSRIHWGCLVLDEGHRVKNEGSGVARAVRSVHRRCTVLLTGTLLQNNLHEARALGPTPSLSLSHARPTAVEPAEPAVPGHLHGRTPLRRSLRPVQPAPHGGLRSARVGAQHAPPALAAPREEGRGAGSPPKDGNTGALPPLRRPDGAVPRRAAAQRGGAGRLWGQRGRNQEDEPSVHAAAPLVRPSAAHHRGERKSVV